MTYADYLRSQGATDEDIKLLDTPIGRKTYDAMQAKIAQASEAQSKAESHYTELKKWQEEVANPTVLAAQAERDIAKAEAVAERARLKALQDAGLVAVAEQQQPKPAAGDSSVDLKNYVTVDTLKQVASHEGDAIAIVTDIAGEHQELFGARLPVREIRELSKQNGKSFEQNWMEKYGVQAKRSELAAKKQADLEAKWKAEGAKEKEAELASRYGDPNTRPAAPSNNPFSNRVVPPPPGSNGTPTSRPQPWAVSESQSSNDRVNKVLKNLNSTTVM